MHVDLSKRTASTEVCEEKKAYTPQVGAIIILRTNNSTRMKGTSS